METTKTEETPQRLLGEPLLTVQECARHARVSRSHIWKLISRGEIPAVRVGGASGPLRIETQVFLAWLYGAPGDDESHPVTLTEIAPWVRGPEVVDDV